MNIAEATAVLRTLAAVAGIAGSDSVTVTLAPYKGHGERSYRKGWRVATAVGWQSDFRRDGIGEEAPSDDAAIDGLVQRARHFAECALERAKHDAAMLTLTAQAATTAAANAEADAEMRRLMLASLDAK